MTDAVVYKLYSHCLLSMATNQQLGVSTGTIATYFGDLAPPCGCLVAEVHELCVRALSAARVVVGYIKHARIYPCAGPKGLNYTETY